MTKYTHFEHNGSVYRSCLRFNKIVKICIYDNENFKYVVLNKLAHNAIFDIAESYIDKNDKTLYPKPEYLRNI